MTHDNDWRSTSTNWIGAYNRHKSKITKIDIINFISYLKTNKALGIKYIKICKRTEKQHKREISINRDTPKKSLFPHSASEFGSWEDHANKTRANDLISLYEYLSSYNFLTENSILIKDDNRIREYANRNSNINYESAMLEIENNIIHHNLYDFGDNKKGWSQTSNITPSTPEFKIDDQPFVGKHHKSFAILNSDQKHFRYILHWETDSDIPFHVPYTICHKIDDRHHQDWFCLRNTTPGLPYGAELLQNHPNSKVIITHRIDWADKLNQTIPTTQWIALAWSGLVVGELPSMTDWSPLRGRRATIITAQNRDDAERALNVYTEISNTLPTTEISFATTNPLDPNRDTTSFFSDIAISQTQATNWIPEITQRYELSQKQITTNKTDTLTFKTPVPNKLTEKNYIIKPFLPSEKTILIYGAPGEGKTWFALLLACSIGSGTPFVNRWITNKKRVLFIAGEMVNDIINRIEQIIHSFKIKRELITIELYPNPEHLIHNEKINLQEIKYQKNLSEAVDRNELIIFDNLTSLTKTANHEKGWKEFEKYNESLKLKGKTTIILHHTAKNSKLQRGTSFREDYVDFIIRINNKLKNQVTATFTKSRDDLTFGEALNDFTIQWDITNGMPRWKVVDMLTQSETLNSNKTEPYNTTKNIFDPLHLDDRLYQFMSYFFMLLNDRHSSISNRDLASVTKLNRGTVLNRINELLKHPDILKKVGSGTKGIRYTLGEKGEIAYSRWQETRNNKE